MRWSNYYLMTAREAPRDAEVISHQLMARAGLVRRLAAGIYTMQPAGWRTARKLMAIVRREMERAGAVELSMPAIQPAELWEESERWFKYGPELLRMEDRHGRRFCFGPTHEEVITDLVRRDVKSYRQMPLNLFQIQTKFRDEIRPRFGLMRGREFIMKDAYSFDATEEGLDRSYQAMYAAYSRIFEACGLEYSVVEADQGTIGGSSSHEFMVLADTGESAVASCAACGYGANVERAEIGALPPPEQGGGSGNGEARRVSTPGSDHGGRGRRDARRSTGPLVVKTLIYETDDGLAAVAIRGDREVNEVKLLNVLGGLGLRLASAEQVAEATGGPLGFSGPVGLSPDVRLVVDESARALSGFVCGANAGDEHLVSVQWDRDVASARPRRTGRRDDGRGRRPLPALQRRRTPHLAGHRGRPHLQAGHGLLREDELHLHRRAGETPPGGDGLLRPRCRPQRRRRRSSRATTTTASSGPRRLRPSRSCSVRSTPATRP